MKPAGLQSASAAEPLSPFLSHCWAGLTVAVNPLPPMTLLPPPTSAAGRETHENDAHSSHRSLLCHCYPRRAKLTSTATEAMTAHHRIQALDQPQDETTWRRLNVNRIDAVYKSKTCKLSHGCVL